MSDDTILLIILLVSNTLSLLGSLFVMTAFLVFKSIRSFSFRLVFFMSTADFIHSISLMLPPYNSWCIIQGATLTFSALSSTLWSFCIAFALYNSAIKENMNIKRYQVWFFLISYGLPLILTIIPFVFDSYGPAKGWCWIKKSFEYDLILRTMCFYIIIWGVMIFNVLVYISVINKLKRDYGNIVEYQSQRNILIKRLAAYPIILVITYLPISFKRIFEIFDEDDMPFWMTCIAAFGISITGLANATVYGFTGPVRTAVKSIFYPENREVSVYSLYTQQYTASFNTNNL
ncbi:hypothetical protein SteCoe_21100 [Stentor coeruleus]|uniref:G-protein coupled receptors family 2 profile 2 domain-containing protein n=1 Tax=Stentor coeruleus TaxID=5963 RepID=A0A1R2BQ89_9CILI|nr:hypothetical protein SteCoe_21100 [Stentor coeruleus]